MQLRGFPKTSVMFSAGIWTTKNHMRSHWGWGWLVPPCTLSNFSSDWLYGHQDQRSQLDQWATWTCCHVQVLNLVHSPDRAVFWSLFNKVWNVVFNYLCSNLKIWQPVACAELGERTVWKLSWSSWQKAVISTYLNQVTCHWEVPSRNPLPGDSDTCVYHLVNLSLMANFY